jgi:hypothetical protein
LIVADTKLQIFGDLSKGLSPFCLALFHFLSDTTKTEQPRQKANSERQEHNEPSIGIPSLGLFDTINPVYDPAEEEFRRRMQRKKKKRGPKL